MHITLETDYAVRIVDFLARSESRVSAQTISERTGVTLRFSLKILRKLVQTGIARSYKGAHGGYVLNRKPEEISVNDILEAIEGPFVFNRCLLEGNVCHRNAKDECCYHKEFFRLSELVKEELQNATFDKFVK